MLAQYLAAYAGILANSTLARRLVAINLEHRVRGLKAPTEHALVTATLRGIGARSGSRKNARTRC